MNNAYNFQFYYWGPFLLKSKLSKGTIDTFLRYGSKLSAKANHDLAGAIENEYYYPQDFILKNSNEIITLITEYINLAYTSWRASTYPIKNYSIQIDDIWLNEQKPKEYNPIHNHTGDISFVFYTSIPNQIYHEENKDTGLDPGEIEFKDRLEPSVTSPGSIRDILRPISSVKEKPKEGDIFIFPSYLHHHVKSFETEGITRKSVAGNISIIEQ